MKKFLIIFLTTLSFLINAQSDPNLKWLHPATQSFAIRWVKMWDANNWYLCGDYGSFRKTTDAGQTWITKNNAGWPRTDYPAGINSYYNATEAWFFDQNNGIVVGSNTNGIIRTIDGGETFDTLRILDGTNAGKNIYSIYFVNSNLGFISGNIAYKIQKTTDGGATWSQLPNLPDVLYNDVYASDELNIIACGESGLVYKTTNGGGSWSTIQVPTLQPLYDLEFINSSTGFVCGGAGFFKSTTDGGATWTGGTNTPIGMTNYKIKTIGSELFVAGNSTKLFKSTDNGSSWITYTNDNPGIFPNLIYSMDVAGSTIVLAGELGNLYKSTDNGSNWIDLTNWVTYASFINSIYVENSSGKMIATGRYDSNPGCIIYSNDGGDTWQPSPATTPFDYMLNRMQMFDNNNGYFAGDGGYFAKTTDGGLSLTPLPIPFAGINKLYNMDFINQTTGWVIGGLPVAGGTSLVARTTDAGLNWTNQTPIGIAGLQLSIDMVDANIGYFGGATLYKTTNGGTNWNTLSIPGITNSVRSIKAFDANNVYVLSSNAEFFITTDGGLNWQRVPVPFETVLSFGMEWYDMNNGILYGVLGTIAKTTDAGLTWETMNTGGWSIAGAKMINPDTFYVGATAYGGLHRYAQPSTQTTFQLSVNVNNGWNMVSTPGLHPVDQNVTTWWSGKDPAAGVFRFSGGYLPVTTTTPGQGYWMKHVGPLTYNTGEEWPAGGIIPVANTPIAGATGWNLIGGYELNVLTSGITTSPAGLQTGSVFQYGSGYTVASNLVPGYGYWIKLTGAGSINIPTSLAKGLAKNEVNTSDWGRIIITDKSGKSYTLYTVKGDVNLNDYELPPAPPEGMFDVRFINDRYAEELTATKTIIMQGLDYPIKVHVEGAEIRLHNETDGIVNTTLKSGENVTINDAKVNKLMVSGTTIPYNYSLEQNYPNPFNPSTNIKFSLPEATEVTITIFNTLGQRVKQLVNGKLDAGKYSYEWNASDVATGMYIYELRTEKFISVKKMMLLK